MCGLQKKHFGYNIIDRLKRKGLKRSIKQMYAKESESSYNNIR